MVRDTDVSTDTYTGILNAYARGRMNSVIPGLVCHDTSSATQRIYAVAHVEPPSMSAQVNLRRGNLGDFDLEFVFFPETSPAYNIEGDCQGRGEYNAGEIGFDGYGPGNTPSDSWLPRVRRPGAYIPFNHTFWNLSPVEGHPRLRLPVPAAGGEVEYQWVEQQSVVSDWTVVMRRP
jgi:hypothetical protein